MLIETGAFFGGMGALIKKMRGKEWLIFPVFMACLYSTFSTTINVNAVFLICLSFAMVGYNPNKKELENVNKNNCKL